jgi:hypothetical protein
LLFNFYLINHRLQIAKLSLILYITETLQRACKKQLMGGNHRVAKRGAGSMGEKPI